MNTQQIRHDSRTLPLVLDAIDIVLSRLETMSPSSDVAALRAAALRHLREAQRWERARPGPAEQELLMKRVLGLHTSIARLELGETSGSLFRRKR
jgi:hypothetical protein